MGKALKRHASPVPRAVPMGQALSTVAANLKTQDPQLTVLVPAQHVRAKQTLTVSVDGLN